MVFVVERYLPGLSRSDLLHGLARLERTQELRGAASGVRYLGSTVVLEDEACFCQFEAPTEAAVAEANRRAGLPFDRIVSAVNVRPERRETMNVSATIPPTVQIRRSRLVGLLGGVAAVAAAATWAVLAFGTDSGSGQTQTSVAAPIVASSPIPMTGYLDGITTHPTVVEDPLMTSSPIPMTGYLDGITSNPTVVEQPSVVSSLSPSERRYVEGIMSLTPLERAAAFGGPGAALDALQLDPKSKRYVEGIMSLSKTEKAAAFGSGK
jgi:hypothetical protein